MNPYEILSVSRFASIEQIRVAWRRASQKYHPDRAGGDAEMMTKVNQAFELLSDPERRAQYDRSGCTRSLAEIEKRAVGLVKDLFNVALQNESEQDFVLVVHAHLREIEEGLKNTRIRLDRRLNKLRRSRARVVSKGESNLFQIIIDAEMNSIEENLEKLTSEDAVYHKAVDIIQDYSDVPLVYNPNTDEPYWLALGRSA